MRLLGRGLAPVSGGESVEQHVTAASFQQSLQFHLVPRYTLRRIMDCLWHTLTCHLLFQELLSLPHDVRQENAESVFRDLAIFVGDTLAGWVP